MSTLVAFDRHGSVDRTTKRAYLVLLLPEHSPETELNTHPREHRQFLAGPVDETT